MSSFILFYSFWESKFSALYYVEKSLEVLKKVLKEDANFMSWCACQEVGMRSVGEGAWTRVYQICKLDTCIDVYYCPRNELWHRDVASAPPPPRLFLAAMIFS